MPDMIGSFEERKDALQSALTALMCAGDDGNDPDDMWLCVEATYPATVICTLRSNNGADSDSFEVPYTFSPNGDVALGEPQPVKLSVIATPEPAASDSDDAAGDSDGDVAGEDADPDDAAMVRFLGPAANAIGDALTFVMAGPTLEGKAFTPLRDQLTRLLDGLAAKGMPPISTDETPTAPTAPTGGAVDDTDDDDPWADLLSDDQPDADAAPADDSDNSDTDSPVDDQLGDDPNNSDDDSDTVTLDPEQVKSELAGLKNLDDDDTDSTDLD